jgi:hypothetical protein
LPQLIIFHNIVLKSLSIEVQISANEFYQIRYNFFKREYMKNKKTILRTGVAFAILMISGIMLNAQHVELSPFVGYETGANISSSYGNLHIGDGMDFGAILNVGMGGGRYGEFSYSHLGSYLDVETGMTTTRKCDLAVDYYSLGFMQEIKPDAKVTPYGLLTLGIVNYRPTTSTDISSENKMHVSIAGGVKINVSEKVGIRLQARLLMPLYYAGTYFYVGTGGSGASMSGGIHGVQGDFTAALVIKIR